MEFKIQNGKYISLEIVRIAMDILRESHCQTALLLTATNLKTNYEFFVCTLSAKMKNLAKLKFVKVRYNQVQMMSESELNLLNRLMKTHDRDESIKIARKIFIKMTLDKLTAVVDESLAGYRETSAVK